ncbi:bifunctional 4-hydroxy-2-oxoglutarate aldolase/2-dehydro-3-deoxy-phosphogluconate aldolase [Brachybacterium fresconis]|uniref:2-dehydro-3-deoxyphosphogluconate aldolase/(4S)-4-hydroxy-2-oxoglutarate aldolase n=1 Tax=Brachybacterium fresconis TaxID=173363 RepID=A0ABS4YN11_9MICO|nr:bifunctional 4-hydroxy-2-oxoglutarate aldolase/2-dehydro-3-deoxy-phosphogluconate aldolase [Brachybacterium fresconis]MBP2409782.1 2-dehydro-3-deoxyphosphogluconate aldolase/(4S)-4-hydroxy-2-oxoglutarate aldolase [Brachybacterium fresconis]
MTSVERPVLPERTAAARLIVVIRGERADQYAPVLETLTAAGIRSVELTLSTPGTLEELPDLLERFGDQLDIGIGTVTDPEDLRTAVTRGAHYIVTPITRADLLEAAAEAGVAIVPGGLTPSELHAGWAAGAAAVKVFPASVVGPGYVKDLRGPFPGIRVIPSGGVDLQAAAAWLQAGADAVSVGGPLLGDALRGGDLEALADRAAQFVGVTTREAGA